jgi:hypothetical protein
LTVGKIRGSIQLNFSTGTVDVPILGTVKPAIQVVPDHIRISSRSTNEIERLAMLRSGDRRAFEVLSAELENADGTVGMEKLADDKWRCRLSVIPSSLTQGSVMRVTTSSPFQPIITVPLTTVR